MNYQNSKSRRLKIGIGKGRGFAECLDLFDFKNCKSKQEFACGTIPVFHDENKETICVKVRQCDLVWMLKKKHIDVAIGSSIWFVEQSDEVLSRTMELEIKPCRLSLIAKKNRKMSGIRRVCTRFPATTREYFQKHGQKVDIVPLQGCHEIALEFDFADAIVDVIETGRTIKRLELLEIDTILDLKHQIWVRSDSNEVHETLEKCLANRHSTV